MMRLGDIHELEEQQPGVLPRIETMPEDRFLDPQLDVVEHARGARHLPHILRIAQAHTIVGNKVISRERRTFRYDWEYEGLSLRLVGFGMVRTGKEQDK